MKITKIEALLVHPESGNGDTSMQKTFGSCHPIFVRVYTDEGIYGDGEAGMLFGTGGRATQCMIEDYGHMILGMNPLHNEEIWDKIYRKGYFVQSGGPIIYAAISAIDMALWDIKGKYFNTSIATLLGGQRRDVLPAYASQLQFGWGGISSPATKPEDFARNAKMAIDDGFKAVKADFFTLDEDGTPLDENVRTKLLSPRYLDLVEHRVAAVREAIGPNADLIMELHSFTDSQSAVQIGQRCKKYGIFYFEEPCTPMPKLQRFVSKGLDIPMATGERVFSRWQYMPFMEDMSIQVLQPDLSDCGGITEAKKICDMAYVYDISIQGHCCGSALTMSATLQFESVIPNFLIHEHHVEEYKPYVNKLCTVNFAPEHGSFTVPQGPGLGTEISQYSYDHAEIVTVE